MAPRLLFQPAVVGVEENDVSGVQVAADASLQNPGQDTRYTGARLTASLPSDATGLNLLAGTPATGAVTGSGSKTVSWLLAAETTPRDVENFLRNLRVVSNGAGLARSFAVTFSVTEPSGSPALSDSSRTVRVQGSSALVCTVDGTLATADNANHRYPTLQGAIDAVAGGAGSQSRRASRIVFARGGSYAAPIGGINIGFSNTPDPDLTALNISGPNAGIAAGSAPGVRVGEAAVEGGFHIGAPQVVLDGFQINVTAANNSRGVTLEVGGVDLTLTNLILQGASNQIGVIVNGYAQTERLHLTRCSFAGWDWNVYVASANGTARSGDVIGGNYFNGGEIGLYLIDLGQIDVRDNVFRNLSLYQVGISQSITASAGMTGTFFTHNAFDASSDVNVLNDTNFPLTVDFTGNWWNSPQGPSQSGHPGIATRAATVTVNSSLTTNPYPNL